MQREAGHLGLQRDIRDPRVGMINRHAVDVKPRPGSRQGGISPLMGQGQR